MRPLLLAALLVPAALAQPSNWELPTGGASVTLEADRPFFTEGNRYEGITSAWSLSTVQPIGPLVRIVGELPFAFARTSGGSSSTALGNLQLGVEADLVAAPITLGGYVRVPTATETGNDFRASLVGVLTENEQIGAFAINGVTASAMAETRVGLGATPGLSLRLRALPSVIVPTGDGGGDSEVFLGYAAQVLYDTGQARLGGGLTGLTALTADGNGDKTQLFAGAMVDLAAGPFRPGLVLRAPISGDIDRFLNAVVGVRLVYAVD